MMGIFFRFDGSSGPMCIDLQALHWNLLEPHLGRVSKPTWLSKAMLDQASENNDYLENQALARPT